MTGRKSRRRSAIPSTWRSSDACNLDDGRRRRAAERERAHAARQLQRCGQGELDLAGVSCLEETRPGRFGIAEPLPHLCRSPDLFSPDLILVPGVAFDRCGRRLGFGGGYYDRLLARPAMRGVAAIGLAYDFQILEELPADPWDVALSGICSEKELLWTKR